MDERDKLIASVKEAVYEISPNADIILFGSRSRGDYTEESDWDFLILIDQEATEALKQRIWKRLFYVELESNKAISSIIHSKKEWEKREITHFYKNVASEGISV